MPRTKQPVYSTSSPEESSEAGSTVTSSGGGFDGSAESEGAGGGIGGSVGELSGLFNRLQTYVAAADQGKGQRIFADLKKTPPPLRRAMFEIMVEKKEEMAELLSQRAEVVKRLNRQSDTLDTMLYECLTGADLGPPSPEPGQTEGDSVSDATYKFQLQTIKAKHTEMIEELERSRSHTERVMDDLVDLQIPFRPISKTDHRRMIDTSNSRYADVEEGIKDRTVSAVLLINNKCLDARRRRRNFTKETTEVLTEWFNGHIEHPYPNDEEKHELAYRCNISVQQITNWFGNRRVRQKRQADRPLQPPASPKRREPPKSNRKQQRSEQHEQHEMAQQHHSQQHQQQRVVQPLQPLQLQPRRQLVALPHQSMLQPLQPPQQQQQAQMMHRASIEDHHTAYQMDQFQPQGLQSNGVGMLLHDPYQMEEMRQQQLQPLHNGGGHNPMQQGMQQQHGTGDKSYTHL